jgi:GDP-D-mannose dehydratase
MKRVFNRKTGEVIVKIDPRNLRPAKVETLPGNATRQARS